MTSDLRARLDGAIADANITDKQAFQVIDLMLPAVRTLLATELDAQADRAEHIVENWRIADGLRERAEQLRAGQ